MENQNSKEETKVVTPSIEDVRFLAKQLRAYDFAWAKKLAKKMKVEYDCVWGINAGNIKNNDLRLSFIEKGLELKDEFEDRSKTAIASLNDYRESLTDGNED